MRIYLIGFMGSGKTTLGRMLASKLDGYSFVDLDKAIETGEGRSIEELFADTSADRDRGGEVYFRELERQYLQDVMIRYPQAVVSTGGGTPCFHDTMELMNADGLTVYLKLSPGTLADRLKGGKTVRPLLQGLREEELLAYITETLAIREKYYERANVVISNPSRDVGRILEVIEPYFHQK